MATVHGTVRYVRTVNTLYVYRGDDKKKLKSRIYSISK